MPNAGFIAPLVWKGLSPSGYWCFGYWCFGYWFFKCGVSEFKFGISFWSGLDI